MIDLSCSLKCYERALTSCQPDAKTLADLQVCTFSFRADIKGLKGYTCVSKHFQKQANDSQNINRYSRNSG